MSPPAELCPPPVTTLPPPVLSWIHWSGFPWEHWTLHKVGLQKVDCQASLNSWRTVAEITEVHTNIRMISWYKSFIIYFNQQYLTSYNLNMKCKTKIDNFIWEHLFLKLNLEQQTVLTLSWKCVWKYPDYITGLLTVWLWALALEQVRWTPREKSLNP